MDNAIRKKMREKLTSPEVRETGLIEHLFGTMKEYYLLLLRQTPQSGDGGTKII
jgi:hypothetical protein